MSNHVAAVRDRNQRIAIRGLKATAFGRGASFLMKTACLQLLTAILVAAVLANRGDAQQPPAVDGAIGLDSRGIIRTVKNDSLAAHPLFQVDENNIPSQFDIFFLGFDAYRDFETAANGMDQLSGILALDKFAGVHTFSVSDPQTVTGPQIDFRGDIAGFNAANPGSPIQLPYFPFQVEIETEDDGLGRDLELAADWRSATNAFQGYFILDAYAGVHFTGNAQVMNFLNNNPGPDGVDKFFDIFKFKPIYLDDFAGFVTGPGETFETQTKDAPYFLFSGLGGLPIAKDLEVMVRFQTLTAPDIADSQDRSQMAVDEGIDVNALFQPIAIDERRLDPAEPVYAPGVAITNGYAILDGFGAVHTLVEDEEGNPVPAPWESPETGLIDPTVDAPYFASPPFDQGGDDFNIAVDVEIMPNGQGYCLLTRLGEVFVVNAPGTTSEDNFVTPGIETRIPLFGFDAARDLELVAAPDGKIAGMYVTDRFGTVHRAGSIPRLANQTLFFPSGFAIDLEVSPYQKRVTAPILVTSPF